MIFFKISYIIILENKKGDFKMKIVKNVSGEGRLPSEFVQMNNWDNMYTPIEKDNELMIEFLESYNGRYKDSVCEWEISYV